MSNKEKIKDIIKNRFAFNEEDNSSEHSLDNDEPNYGTVCSGHNLSIDLSNILPSIADENRPYESFIPLKQLIKAPNTWNIFRPLSKEKMIELVESIDENGLQHSIVVWEREDDYYMILSGHNRFKAYEMLRIVTNNPKYETIPARVYNFEDLTELRAREIIIDTNWVQRTLSPVEISAAIAERTRLINARRKDSKNNNLGRTRDQVAEFFNIKGRMVDNYLKIRLLIEPLLNLIDKRKISVDAGARLANFTHEVQKWIYDNFVEDINSNKIKRLRPEMKEEEIKEILKEDKKTKEKFTKAKIQIPYGHEKAISELLQKWAEDNGLDFNDLKFTID